MKLNISVTKKQKRFIDAKSSEVLFGGAAGGGKSYGQMVDALIYALRYKNGMMPTIKNGINTIDGAVSDIKSVSERVKSAQEETAGELKERLKMLENVIRGIEKALESSEKLLKNLDTGAMGNEKFTEIISEQISLLYDVFMLSSIPEEQKDAVGHRVEKMHAIISSQKICSVETDKQ